MLARVINPFESLFDEFFSEMNLANNKMIQKCKNHSNFPRHNIITTQKQVVIQLAVPGYKEQQLSVYIQDNVLNIQGSASTQKATQGVIAHSIKSSYFKKSYQLLDANLSRDNINCQLSYGVLKITIPKITQDKPKQKLKKLVIKKK